MPSNAPATVDAFAPTTLEDPYPYYRELREHSPVHYVRSAGYYVVTRYDDVRAAALDTETFSSRLITVALRGRPLPFVEPLVHALGPIDVLAIQDAPAHGPQRKLLTRFFSREAISREEPAVRASVERRLGAMRAAETSDAMRVLAGPLPVETTLRMLGKGERLSPLVKRWTDQSVELLSGLVTELRFARIAAGQLAFHAFSGALLFDPGARARSSILHAITQARRAGEVSAREAASMVMQLLIAGSDSTASLIGSAMRILTEQPAMMDRLHDEPEKIPAFIEEVLRLETPFQGHFRVTTRDVELAGTHIPAGSRVMLVWASANRDERVFAAPDEIDLDRSGRKLPLAFGHGIHLCLGAALARMQARVAIEVLVRDVARVHLVGPRPLHKPSAFTRTLDTLHVRLEPRQPKRLRSARNAPENASIT
jgi:cytochrome P450 family 144